MIDLSNPKSPKNQAVFERIGDYTFVHNLHTTDNYTKCHVCGGIPVTGFIYYNGYNSGKTVVQQNSYVCSKECFVMWLLQMEE